MGLLKLQVAWACIGGAVVAVIAALVVQCGAS